MTGWTTPDQDTMQRIVSHLQRPDWRITSPASSDSDDGRWHATNGKVHRSAASLDARLDELDWFHAT